MNDSETTFLMPRDIDHFAPRPSRPRLVYLDGWRGLCIIAVLLGHFLPFHAVNFADMGVEMFFVLSGRLMADILFVEKFPLTEFYVRRFSRVWPGLAVYVFVCAAIFSNVPGFLQVTPKAVVAALLFLTNYRVMLLGETQLLDHTWSLAVEEHAYLALGILAYILRNKPVTWIKWLILGLALLMSANGMLQAYIFPAHDIIFEKAGKPPVFFNPYWRSDIRAASVFLAAFFYLHFFTRGKADLPRFLCVLLAFTGLLSFLAMAPQGLSFTLGTLCLAATVCALDGQQNPFRGMLRGRVLVAFGTYSYSIYLWQQIFYKLFQFMRDAGILTPLMGGLFRPAFVVAACGAGVLSYYYVEKPARHFINRQFHRRAAAADLVR